MTDSLEAAVEARRIQWQATKTKWEKKKFQEWQKGHIEGHLEENAEIQNLIKADRKAQKERGAEK